MSKKSEKKQLIFKIVAIVLCALMVFGSVASVLVYLL